SSSPRFSPSRAIPRLVRSPTPSLPRGPTPPRVAGKMPFAPEDDDPVMDHIEVAELSTTRLESLAFARMKPHIGNNASTSSAQRPGFPAIILVYVPHDLE
ncbi:hypothetical protein HAX54_042915, partial [Datura stramonium]|nr:hypothetical protein [Datura stramonium]